MTALYAYAIVSESLDPVAAPGGIDGATVRIEREGDLAVLVSSLDDRAYDPDTVAVRSHDVEWLGARAAAHDRVITWAADLGTVIPLPLFSLFRDVAGVRHMLSQRHGELRQTLRELGDAREYTVRVFRVDAELTAHLAVRSPEVARLEARAASASPGQQYLLDRKLEEARRVELERVGRETAAAVYAALDSLSRRSSRDPVASRPEATGQAVLNASFLVDAVGVHSLRAAVTRLIAAYGSQGFRFEFTGPWAPYHFVQPADHADADPPAAPARGAGPTPGE